MNNIDKILRKERFKLKIRQNARKAKIATGLALVLAGSTFGTIKAIDARNMSETPVVQEYKAAYDDLSLASAKMRQFSVTESLAYTPSDQRVDYSDSQAHSEIEQAYQNLMFTRSKVAELDNNPVVKDFVNTENSAFYGYTLGGLGLLLGINGLRRRE